MTTKYHLTWLDLAWIGWLLYFLAFEINGLIINVNDTLSGTVWAIEDIDMSHPFFHMWTPTHWYVAITIWLLFAWLSVHLTFGLLR